MKKLHRNHDGFIYRKIYYNIYYLTIYYLHS